MKFHPRLAPIKAAVFPLVKKEGMPEKADAIYRDLKKHFNVFFEAINLTDNVYHTRGRFDNQTLNVVDYGRSFTVGARAKF